MEGSYTRKMVPICTEQGRLLSPRRRTCSGSSGCRGCRRSSGRSNELRGLAAGLAGGVPLRRPALDRQQPLHLEPGVLWGPDQGDDPSGTDGDLLDRPSPWQLASDKPHDPPGQRTLASGDAGASDLCGAGELHQRPLGVLVLAVLPVGRESVALEVGLGRGGGGDDGEGDGPDDPPDPAGDVPGRLEADVAGPRAVGGLVGGGWQLGGESGVREGTLGAAGDADQGTDVVRLEGGLPSQPLRRPAVPGWLRTRGAAVRSVLRLSV